MNTIWYCTLLLFLLWLIFTFYTALHCQKKNFDSELIKKRIKSSMSCHILPSLLWHFCRVIFSEGNPYFVEVIVVVRILVYYFACSCLFPAIPAQRDKATQKHLNPISQAQEEQQCAVNNTWSISCQACPSPDCVISTSVVFYQLTPALVTAVSHLCRATAHKYNTKHT